MPSKVMKLLDHDTGATLRMQKGARGMTNLKKLQTLITFGNSEDLILPVSGNMSFVARDKSGQAYNNKATRTLVQRMLFHPKLLHN